MKIPSLFIMLLCVGVASAQLVTPSDTIKARLETLTADPLLNSTQLGLLVYDLTADSVLYSHGGQQTLRPASTMKLVTAITALDLLGSDYTYRTYLYYTGKVTGRTLDGDVYLVGGMDPLFDEIDLHAFTETLIHMGIDSVRGRIVCDTSFKEEHLLGEGWCWDDDNPVLTPLLISRKDEMADRFVGQMREKGVVIDAPITNGRLPKEALLVCSRSHRLSEVLLPMMKESDNLYAETMFFQIAAKMGKRPATAAHARQLIKQTIARTGFSGVPYKVADGSGLSLYNYVTPALLVSLLRYAYLHRDLYAGLLPTLPIAGEDGTLKKRMSGRWTKGNVRAKTGTLSGISSLAGYCRTADQHQLAFCIINQGVMRAVDGRAFQDRVCEALCQPVVVNIEN